MTSFEEFILAHIRDNRRDYVAETYPAAQHISFRDKNDDSKVTVEFFGPLMEISLYFKSADKEPVYRRYTRSEVVQELLQEATEAVLGVSEHSTPNVLILKFRGKPV
jgi:hypothetical protein